MITNVVFAALAAAAIYVVQVITLGTIVGVVFPILTIIIGGACALLLSMTTTLRASNGDLRDRVTDLESEQKIDKALIQSQKSDLDALRKIVTGEVQLAAITDLLQHHHEAAIVHWEAVQNSVDSSKAEILTAMKDRS